MASLEQRSQIRERDLAAAGRALGMPKSRLSRRVARLEGAIADLTAGMYAALGIVMAIVDRLLGGGIFEEIHP